MMAVRGVATAPTGPLVSVAVVRSRWCHRTSPAPGRFVVHVNREDPLLRVLVMSTLSARRRPVEGDSRQVDLTTAGSFDTFYLREMRGLVALVLALSGSGSTAQDVAQDAMLATYRDWDRIATLDDPASWVRRIAANPATSALRRRSAELRALTRLGGRRQLIAEMEPRDDAFWGAVRGLSRRHGRPRPSP